MRDARPLKMEPWKEAGGWFEAGRPTAMSLFK